MLTYKKTYNIYRIEREWKCLQDQKCLTSPFQSFDFMQRSWRFFYPYYFMRRCLPVFYSFYDKSECVLIIPLVKYIKEDKVALFGNVNGFNYTDIIAKNTTYIKEALGLLARECDTIGCYKVLESSPLWKVLYKDLADSQTTNNVCINFGNDYELYNKSLSKSVRQNLRTSYNRLATDSKSLKFSVLTGGGGYSKL